jgi:hypothetical protein
MSSYPGSGGELASDFESADTKKMITIRLRPVSHGRRSKLPTTQQFRTIIKTIEEQYCANCRDRSDQQRTATLKIERQFVPGLRTYLQNIGLEAETSRHRFI